MYVDDKPVAPVTSSLCRCLPLLLLLTLAAPGPASSQVLGQLEQLFQQVNSISVFAHGGRILGPTELSQNCAGNTGLCGLGSEVLINLPSPNFATLELALGTSFLRGFEAKEPTLDLRGAARSLPTVSLYATLNQNWVASPYLGVNFGVLQLWNVRGYDPEGAQYSVTGETYEYGGGLGLYLERWVRGLYSEVSYRRRNFASLDWSAAILPAGWPRTLNLSGVQLSFGWQIPVSERRGLPEFTGSWLLARVDGQELPVLLEQQDTSWTEGTSLVRGSVRREIITGSLVLESPGEGASSASYALGILRRSTILNANGQSLRVAHDEVSSTGRYTVSGDSLVLAPADASAQRSGFGRSGLPAVRSGDAIRRADDDLVIRAWGLHTLRFRKGRP